MQARIVALLLVVATLWSLIGVHDFDPSLVADEATRIHSAESADPRGTAPAVVLADRVWSAQAEIPADLPDGMPERLAAVRPDGAGAGLLREPWLAQPPPFLDGPRRPPRDRLDA